MKTSPSIEPFRIDVPPADLDESSARYTTHPGPVADDLREFFASLD